MDKLPPEKNNINFYYINDKTFPYIKCLNETKFLLQIYWWKNLLVDPIKKTIAAVFVITSSVILLATGRVYTIFLLLFIYNCIVCALFPCWSICKSNLYPQTAASDISLPVDTKYANFFTKEICAWAVMCGNIQASCWFSLVPFLHHLWLFLVKINFQSQ